MQPRKTRVMAWLVLGMLCSCSDEPAVPGDAMSGADRSVAEITDAAGGEARSAVDAGLERGIPDAATEGQVGGGDCEPAGTVLEVGPGKSFATIAAALEQAAGAATILVADGIYDESLTVQRGGDGQTERLLICSAHSRGATIRASGRVLRLQAPWVTVQGFVLDGGWGQQDLVRADDAADHLILRDLELRYGQRDGIDLGGGAAGGLEDVLIDGCTIHHFLAGSTSDQQDAHCIVATDFNRLTIRNTEVYYCSGDSLQVGTDRDPWDGLLVEGCRFWTGPLPANAADFRQGEVPGENAFDTKARVYPAPWRGSFTLRDSVFFGFDAKSAYISNRAALNLKDQVTGLVERCTLFDNEIALRVRGAGSYGGVDGLDVINTVFYRNRYHVRVEDDALHVRWLHNTFGRLLDEVGEPLPPDAADSQVNTFRGGGGGDEGAGWQTENNLYLASALPQRATGAGDAFSADPSLFADLPVDDYHLARQLDASASVGVTVDRDGKPRSADTPDVGAYER